MAIYHFSAKVISRAVGSSAVAAAAYRSADRLRDERLGRSHDFSNKAGVVHSDVLLPEGADEQWRDRERLWNDVEAAELRKDAQLAREIEFAIPREMIEDQGIELARDFVRREFVDRGMIADLNVHWDIGLDGLAKPHAHVMLTMREIRIGEDGNAEFGAKVRDWNRTELLTHWREVWADHVNERLAALDIDARIDHRTLEAQGIDLEPQHKIGPAASRMAAEGLEADRANEHIEIARSNGERIIADPGIALDAITHRQATFTNRDPQYREWAEDRDGVYATNGALLAVVLRSSLERPVPDLFCYAILGHFTGYYPTYSSALAANRNCLTWVVLKGHTANTAGEVTLRSGDPRDTPAINFRYFDEGNDGTAADLQSVVDGIRFVRGLSESLRRDGLMAHEELPGEALTTDDQLREFVRNTAWGHHASCTCPMGPREKGGVLTPALTVHGTTGLRVVDASVFPRIPGLFIVSAVYMAAEKGADMIIESARR